MECPKSRIRINGDRIDILCFRKHHEIWMLQAGCPDCDNNQCIIKKIKR